jgi:hypothetical protein
MKIYKFASIVFAKYAETSLLHHDEAEFLKNVFIKQATKRFYEMYTTIILPKLASHLRLSVEETGIFISASEGCLEMDEMSDQFLGKLFGTQFTKIFADSAANSIMDTTSRHMFLYDKRKEANHDLKFFKTDMAEKLRSSVEQGLAAINKPFKSSLFDAVTLVDNIVTSIGYDWSGRISHKAHKLMVETGVIDYGGKKLKD